MSGLIVSQEHLKILFLKSQKQETLSYQQWNKIQASLSLKDPWISQMSEKEIVAFFYDYGLVEKIFPGRKPTRESIEQMRRVRSFVRDRVFTGDEVAAVATRLKINPSLIYKWVAKMKLDYELRFSVLAEYQGCALVALIYRLLREVSGDVDLGELLQGLGRSKQQ